MDLYLILSLVAGLLVIVSLIQPLAARMGVSASVVVAVVGIAIGASATFVLYTGAGGVFGDVAAMVVHLPVSSEAFLYIFLPILLFQTALNIDVPRLIEDAAPILLLAVVAVLVATLVIGAALAPAAGVPAVACLMLGAIVATTDPVAVIGIFHDVGAPSRLSRLVEGESLLNDAAAITLFTVLLDMLIAGRSTSFGIATLQFLWTFAGGVAAGYAGARVIVALVAWLQDLRLAQVTLTLALPYLVFIVSERALGVSGVVAAVTSGLVLSAIGQPRIAPNDWRFLHDMWEQLGFWASSLIFILASLLVPRLLLDVGWHDLWLLLVLVAAALAARALVLFGLLPALSALKLSQRVDTKFKVVILWGGLRGAVTLALALAVTENARIGHDVQRFIAVLATGFVLFTLLINGTTLRVLLRVLGLDRLSPFDQALRNQVLALSRGRVADTVRTIGHRYRFPDALIDGVVTTYEPPGKAAGAAPAAGVPAGAPAAAPAAAIPAPAAALGSRDDLMRLGLVSLATREREIVLEHFQARTVSGRVVEELLTGVGRLIDHTRAQSGEEYLEAAQEMVAFSKAFRIAYVLHRRFRIDGPLVDKLADRFEMLLVSWIVLEELVPYVEEKLAPLVGTEVAPLLTKLLQQREQMTSAALEALRAQYPEYALLLERRFLNRVALRHEDVARRTLFEEGLIGPELDSVLHRELKATRAQVDVRPRLDLGLETRALLAHVPMFASLAASELDAVAHLLRPRLAVPGERLIRRGDKGDAMYFISSGLVMVEAAGGKIALAQGDFFGEMALLMDLRRQADVTALSYCQLLVLQDDDFKRLLKRTPAIKKRIDEVAGDRSRMNEEAAARRANQDSANAG